MHTCRQQRVTDAMRTIGGRLRQRWWQRRMPAAAAVTVAMAATCVIPVGVGRRNFSRSWPAQAGRRGPNGPVLISPAPTPAASASAADTTAFFLPLADNFCAPDDDDADDAKRNDRHFAQLPKTRVAVRNEGLYRKGRKKQVCL